MKQTNTKSMNGNRVNEKQHCPYCRNTYHHYPFCKMKDFELTKRIKQ